MREPLTSCMSSCISSHTSIQVHTQLSFHVIRRPPKGMTIKRKVEPTGFLLCYKDAGFIATSVHDVGGISSKLINALAGANFSRAAMPLSAHNSKRETLGVALSLCF